MKYIMVFILSAVMLLSLYIIGINNTYKEGNRQTKEFMNCIIKYDEEDKDNIETIGIMMSYYMPMLENDFGIKPEKPTIIIYNKESELKKAVGSKGEKPPLGVYSKGRIHILSPNCFSGENKKLVFMKNGALLHEVVHYFVTEKSGGKCPVYINEGIALYYELKYLGVEWRKDLEGKTDNITKKQLEEDFYSLDEASAYRKSFELMKGLYDKYGEITVNETLKNF